MLGGFWHYRRKVSDEKPVAAWSVHGRLPKIDQAERGVKPLFSKSIEGGEGKCWSSVRIRRYLTQMHFSPSNYACLM
jgi:hypothetical protein